MSIRTKLIIMFLAIALIPLLFFSVLTFNNYKNSLATTHLSDLQNIAAFKADKIETYFSGLKANMEMVQGIYVIKKNLSVVTQFARQPDNPELLAARELIDGSLRNVQRVLGLVDIMLVNSEGKVVYALNPEHYPKKFFNLLPDPQQKAFGEGKKRVYFSDIFFNKANRNKPGMLVTAPAFDLKGILVGVIAFEVDMAHIYTLIQDVTDMGETGETLIGKKMGNQVIFLNPLRHDPEAALKRKINIGEKEGSPIQAAVQRSKGAGNLIDYRGKKVLAAWQYIPSLDWGIVAKIDAQEAFADVANLRHLTIIILIIIFVLASIMAFSIAQSISDPIKRLSQGAEIIGGGNLEYRVGTNLKDEIGHLSRSFDKMTQDLKSITASRDELNKEIAERKEAEEALRESREDLTRAQAVGNTGSWRLDVKRNKLTWSDENHHIFGIPKGTSMTYETFLSTVHPDDRDYVDTKWKEGLAGGSYDIEHRIIVDGQAKWVREKAYLEYDSKGALVGGFGITQDITERKQMEEKIRKSRGELEIRVQQRTKEIKEVVEALQIEMGERKRAEQALKTASLYTRSLIEASLDPLVTISADGKVTDVNRATEMVTGASRDKLIGSDFADYFTEPEKAKEGYKEVFSRGTVRDYPLAIRHKSGFVTDVLYNATLYRNEAGEIQGVFAAARDVTERNAIESRTNATNALLSLFSQKPSRKEYLDAVVDLIHSWSGYRCVGIRILDDKGYIPYESYRGFSREFWESESRLSIEHAQCVCMRVISGNPDPQDASMMTPGGSFHCEDTGAFVARLSRKEQARFRGVCIQNGFLSLSIVPIRSGEKILGSIQVADNEKKNLPLPSIEFLESMSPLIGEAINRFNLEDEIRESESHLRLLSSQLLTVQEDERKRISAELHDDIAAKLAAIKFALEKRLMLTGKMHQEVNQSLKDIISMVLETIVSTRRIMINLRPAMIDDLGILATLNWYCREFEQIFTTIHVEKQVNIEEIEIPDYLKIVIFRIVQEGMNNIAKHSGANHISLALEKTNDTLTLSIEDNGRGFDVEKKTLKAEIFQGLGIVNMKERARLSGGYFSIKSFKEKGTFLKVTWPLKPIAMDHHLRIEPS